jgi:Tfp pilus assembly protein PilF
VVAEYARLIVWPARLSPDYSYNQIPVVTSVLDGRLIVGVLLVAGCLAGIGILWRRSPVAAFGLSFAALTYSVVSNFAITIGTICAERLIYLPSAGIVIAAAIGAERLARRRPASRWLLHAGLVVLAVSAAWRTWTRNADWASEVTLWSAAIAVSPESARVQSEYGRVLLSRAEQEAAAGRPADAAQLFGQARTHFERALAIYPSYSPPMDGLATIHAVHQQYDQAHELFARAVTAQPSNFAALANWAGLLWEQAAQASLQAADLRQKGSIPESAVLDRQADAGFRDAMEKVDRALAIQPSYAHAHLIRGLILDDHRGDSAGAIAEFEEVLRLMPNHPQRAVIEQKLSELRAPG